MIARVLVMFFGYILMVLGITYILIYMNLFTFGYTIKEYLLFLFTRYECYFLLVGFMIEVICLVYRKDAKK